MAINFPTQPKCNVHNCGNPQVAKGFCETHYKRLKRHGTVSDEVGKKLIDGELLSRHPLYASWRNMTRTNGGKDVCDRWKDIRLFVEDAGEKPDGAHALMRIDASLPYGPGNARWSMLCRDDETRAKITEKAKQRYKEIREANPEYYRDYDLRKKYGIGVAEYNEMFAAQNGVCAICKKPESRVDKRANRISNLAIDHCHTTGKVRGLLCHHCNAMLGSSLDSIENLEKGIQYLRRHLNLDPSPKIV